MRKLNRDELARLEMLAGKWRRMGSLSPHEEMELAGGVYDLIRVAQVVLEDRDRLRKLIRDLRNELMDAEISGDEILPAERALLAWLEGHDVR